jgi:hypothetical protein
MTPYVMMLMTPYAMTSMIPYASERREGGPLRPPPKKADNVLAAFTFVLPSDLIPKELAVFRKQETRIEN